MAMDITAVRASDFAQSIGVNTHIVWKDTAGYSDAGVVARSLAYLGATHVRDGVPYEGWTLPDYEAIARTGVKFDLVASGPAVDIGADLARIARLEQAVPGSVAAIEGANEFNTQNHVLNGISSRGDPAWAQYYGPQLYNAVRANPLLAGKPVIAASMAGATPADLQRHGNVDTFVDRGNWHTYYSQGSQPLASLQSGISLAKSLAPTDPVLVTETGYYTAVDAMDWGGGGVSQPVQAILTVNLLLDAFKLGAKQTYLYELMDNINAPSSTDIENSFGLFQANGTPKQAATAIHNLTTLLTDTGSSAATFTPGTLGATITGLPATGTPLTLQKSNGTFDMVVWNEPQVWNQASRSAVTPPATEIAVDLGATYAAVKVFDPLAGTNPIQTLANARTVRLSLADHPFIIEVAPSGGTSGSVSPPARPGAAPDILKLRLSEDAWNGHAQFEVAIDGKILGLPQMVFASHALKDSEEFVFTGDFGPGQHKLSVKFLNDVSGGTPSTDRNLYLLDVTLNDRNYLADMIPVYGGGTLQDIIVAN